MTPKWMLIKIAARAVRNPDEASKTFLYIILGVVGSYLLLGTFAMNMVGALLDQFDNKGWDLLDDAYDMESTQIYQDVSGVYDEFRGDMIRAMDEREAEIIAENTTYVQEEVEQPDGSVELVEKAVCSVTVTKAWNDFSLSYLFAYINHHSDVKNLDEYQFDHDEIYGVCESICTMQEDHPDDSYFLYTVTVPPDEAAKLFFTEDDVQKMYVVSYDLYDSLLNYTSSTYAATAAGAGIDTDGSGTSASGNRGTKANGSASEKLKALFPDGIPQTEAEMKKYLTTVTITVRDKEGNLTTRQLTVHTALADDVVAIFQEIADSGFCAYDVGAYVWRSMAASGNRSHHSYGVAIDINPNENYMIKNGKVVAGSCWSPSSNPYSFGPDSPVVQAFKKRGWVWGGDWNSSKDYMHFSYTGY